MENSSRNQESSQQSCYTTWMNLQEQDLTELLHAIDHTIPDADDNHDHAHTAELSQLVDKNIRHYEEYVSNRSNLARQDVTHYFHPSWCTSLEGSMLWAGGCRPSIFIRLIYALSSHEMVPRLEGHVSNGRVVSGGLGELSATQLGSINTLQVETILHEEAVSKKLASLQEEITDDPIAIIAKELQVDEYESREADEALDELSESLMSVLEEADNLRLKTLKELIGILTPIQAVDFLAAGRKLNLCVHAWGKNRDRQRGRAAGSH